jgi:uncharacterized integral membrane protein
VVLLVALALVLIGAQYTQPITLHFFTFEARAVPAVVALIGAAVAGATISWLLSAPGRVRGLLARRKLERAVGAADERTVAALSEASLEREHAQRHQAEARPARDQGRPLT